MIEEGDRRGGKKGWWGKAIAAVMESEGGWFWRNLTQPQEMGRWLDGECVWDIEWRRPLLDRKRAAVIKLQDLLSNFSLTEVTEDRWHWGRERNGFFFSKRSVQGA